MSRWVIRINHSRFNISRDKANDLAFVETPRVEIISVNFNIYFATSKRQFPIFPMDYIGVVMVFLQFDPFLFRGFSWTEVFLCLAGGFSFHSISIGVPPGHQRSLCRQRRTKWKGIEKLIEWRNSSWGIRNIAGSVKRKNEEWRRGYDSMSTVYLI